MRHWLIILGFLMTACAVTTTLAAAKSAPAPRSDGRVWNIDFEGFLSGGALFLNAGVLQLGDGAPNVVQKDAEIIRSQDLAYSGDRCAHIVVRQPGPSAQIQLQRRFDVKELPNEVIEFLFRPTADKPVDLREFTLWTAKGYQDGNAGIALYANGKASEGTYNIDVRSGGNADARVRDAVAGLKQTEWIRVVMARNEARNNVALWVGPPDHERFIGEYSDVDPERRLGRASIGNLSPESKDNCGEGYWDDIRVGRKLLPGRKLAPGEVVRDVSREAMDIKYPIEVGRKKQLFVDDVVIESMTDLKRTLNPLSKHPRNPLLQAELPWEVKCQYFLPYMTLREAPDKPFRAWYGCYVRGGYFRNEQGQQINKLTYVCLAESDDGLQWTRRDVNRYKIDGAAENAAVWEGRAFKTIFDPLDSDPRQRYKGMTRVGGFTPVFSPDGIQWNMASQNALSWTQAGDATSFHWNSLENKWIASVKIWRDAKRIRGYAESDDFLHWSDTYPMLACDGQDGPKDETYSMRIFPYETMFVGLLKIYHLETDQCDVQLAFSRNAKHWQRPDRTPFLANAKVEGDYDHGNIDEAGDPITVGEQLWFYYSGRSTLHEEKSEKPDGSLCLGTLRLDGFMSLDAVGEEGSLVTKPLRLVGDLLWVNADAKDGEIRAEITDAESLMPIGAFTKANCAPLAEDNVRQRLTWQGAAGLPRDKPVRMTFCLRNTKLYSFWTE